MRYMEMFLGQFNDVQHWLCNVKMIMTDVSEITKVLVAHTRHYHGLYKITDENCVNPVMTVCNHKSD
jgi:predicted small metal-binding protein